LPILFLSKVSADFFVRSSNSGESIHKKGLQLWQSLNSLEKIWQYQNIFMVWKQHFTVKKGLTYTKGKNLISL